MLVAEKLASSIMTDVQSVLREFRKEVNSVLTLMVIQVLEFSWEGYKIRQVFGYKSILQKENIVFCGKFSKIGHLLENNVF